MYVKILPDKPFLTTWQHRSDEREDARRWKLEHSNMWIPFCVGRGVFTK